VRQKAGRITTAGTTKEVVFEPVDGLINDLVARASRAKPLFQLDDRRTHPTIKVIPRETSA
jgi:hypothetical protein